jgi:AAA+ ATPase superfamily predicted ATPase
LGSRGLEKALSRIEVSGLKLDFSEKRLSIIGMVLEGMGRWAEDGQVVLTLDEAQELRNIGGFSEILAHIYDYLKRVKILLAGSEIGFLDRFIGVRNLKPSFR